MMAKEISGSRPPHFHKLHLPRRSVPEAWPAAHGRKGRSSARRTVRDFRFAVHDP